MKEYHKIQTVFNRDPATNFKTVIYGDYSLPEFEYLKDNEWVFTEKVDGTNIRIMWDAEKKKLNFGGKTDNAQIPAFLVNTLHEMFQPEYFEPLFDSSICLYGEGYGPKIQSSGKYRQSQSFVLFDVKCGEWWLQRKDVEDVALKFGIDVVPIVGRGSIKNMVEMTRVGFRSLWGDFLSEGIVARPVVELKARNGSRIITKIKYKDFQR